MELRVPGPDAEPSEQPDNRGLSDAEFAIPGQIVADIGLERPPPTIRRIVSLFIEALTIAE